ncbi:uncharacterized protein LOC124315004 isoform X3 [Daphnia pulicaria]|uniref:uncharacterized protein LOC124315004 isoform X3 n=1 Tax=Daphnia pulicaria TaxID=35523 RepID=UPI001EEBF985|nr:uncharacterized protein LOC124315004 isoform X3 [Daphnia pulicaria]
MVEENTPECSVRLSTAQIFFSALYNISHCASISSQLCSVPIKMITFTLFQLTVVFELLFFLLWAFPNWANLPAGKLISQVKQNDLLDDRSTLGSCDVEDKCGLCTNTTKEGGAIESSNFRDEDAPDLNCSFNIQAPPGSRIQLAFTQFLVDKCCDFITVSDGKNDPFELRFNGSNIPEPITFPSSQIVVKFTRNTNNTSSFNSTTNNSARWQARYKFLADKNLVSQLETVNLKPSTSNEI